MFANSDAARDSGSVKSQVEITCSDDEGNFHRWEGKPFGLKKVQ